MATEAGGIDYCGSGMRTLGLGRLLEEPELAPSIILQTKEALADLSSRDYQIKHGVMTGALRLLKKESRELGVYARDLGITLSVVSPEEEGQLAWLGASDSLSETGCAVLDIGGYSAQLIIGRNRKVNSVQSLPIGCQHLTQKFFPTLPPSTKEMAELGNWLHSFLREAGWSVPDDHPLILVGGTASACACLEKRVPFFEPTLINGVELTQESCERFIAELGSLTEDQTREWLPFDSERAPVFLAGCVSLLAVMKAVKKSKAKFSARSVRHGLLQSLLLGK